MRAAPQHAGIQSLLLRHPTVARVLAPCLLANAPAAILNAQTDVVRDELAPSRVTVAALHVGFMDTNMVADVDAPKEDSAAAAAAALDGVENGLVEVLVGDRTRQAKAGLAADGGPSGRRSNRAVQLKRDPIRQIRRRHDSATSPNTVLNRRSTTQVSIDLPGPLRPEVPT